MTDDNFKQKGFHSKSEMRRMEIQKEGHPALTEAEARIKELREDLFREAEALKESWKERDQLKELIVKIEAEKIGDLALLESLMESDEKLKKQNAILVSALELIGSMGGRNSGCDYCARHASEALKKVKG